jgi:hypothetical protein
VFIGMSLSEDGGVGGDGDVDIAEDVFECVVSRAVEPA